jgi:hypothetical protein
MEARAGSSSPPEKRHFRDLEATIERSDDRRTVAIQDRLSSVPKSAKGTYLRAVAGRSRQAAIKAHCLECVGWVRDEVRLCSSPACALWAYRPFQDAA